MKARIINYAVTLIIVVLAALAAFTLYRLYLANPWTRDGQVRANVVGIAPRVSGPVIQVAVHDNQQVKKGDLLFEIDPTDFAAQVDVANGQLLNAEANLKQREQDLGRQKRSLPKKCFRQAGLSECRGRLSSCSSPGGLS
jgi:multidrug resistance efflux pump